MDIQLELAEVQGGNGKGLYSQIMSYRFIFTREDEEFGPQCLQDRRKMHLRLILFFLLPQMKP